jgi:hypothetical protein
METLLLRVETRPQRRRGCEVKRRTLNPVVEPRNKLVGWPKTWIGTQATGPGSVRTRDWLRPGVVDGIEQHIVARELTRRVGGVLGSQSERVEYVRSTSRRRLTKDHRSGMAAGIAKKSGNADGVKAATVIACERANINYTQG